MDVTDMHGVIVRCTEAKNPTMTVSNDLKKKKFSVIQHDPLLSTALSHA